ncbi:MAG: peptidylprolyl isomerase [Planctomycetaceae bacterium]
MANRKAEVDAAVADVDFDSKKYQIEFDTSMGKITLDLFPDVAPGHCKNIIGLTKIGFYDGIIFHRVIKGFMNQAGCPQGNGMGGPGYQIDAEFNDIKHEPGILSAARTADPNSAGSQFFLVTATSPHLDGQYTVYGKTADDESLGVVMAIGEVPTGPNDRPLEDVTIQSAKVIETDK